MIAGQKSTAEDGGLLLLRGGDTTATGKIGGNIKLMAGSGPGPTVGNIELAAGKLLINPGETLFGTGNNPITLKASEAGATHGVLFKLQGSAGKSGGTSNNGGDVSIVGGDAVGGNAGNVLLKGTRVCCVSVKRENMEGGMKKT